MASGKRSAWKRRVREFCNYLLCLVLGGIFLFMGLTQPIYTEENTMEIYSDSEEALMSSQGRRLYPIPLLICTDGTEYTFGFSCYKKIPSDFNSTPHSIRIRVYTGYNWRPWDATPEIAELEADSTGIFALSAYDIFLSPTVQRKRQAKERAKRKAQKRDRSNCESAPKS